MIVPSRATIDVLIPAYNAEATIQSAVASIQGQTIRDIRIIIVNDGSTDATGDLLRKMAEDDPRIEVIETPNRGIVDALNSGLEICQSDYIARHDADDIAFPDRLERQLRFLEENPDFVAVGANCVHIDKNGDRIGTRSRWNGEVKPDANWVPSKEPYLMHPFLLVRRDAFQQVGGYRHVFHSEDTDLYWRLLEIGRLSNLPDLLGEYRVHAGSISSAAAVNGRIAAVNSQLAALSFRRRKRGDQDIDFLKETLSDYVAAKTLRRIYEIASSQLTIEERKYLKIAVAAKFLSLLEYRPYYPSIEDCQFMHGVLKENRQFISRQNRRDINYFYGALAIRLLRAFKFQELHAIAFPMHHSIRTILSIAKRRLRDRGTIGAVK